MDLIDAVESNDMDNVRRLLLDNNININIKDKYGRTAFIWAIIKQNIEIINLF